MVSHLYEIGFLRPPSWLVVLGTSYLELKLKFAYGIGKYFWLLAAAAAAATTTAATFVIFLTHFMFRINLILILFLYIYVKALSLLLLPLLLLCNSICHLSAHFRISSLWPYIKKKVAWVACSKDLVWTPVEF